MGLFVKAVVLIDEIWQVSGKEQQQLATGTPWKEMKYSNQRENGQSPEQGLPGGIRRHGLTLAEHDKGRSKDWGSHWAGALAGTVCLRFKGGK